MKLFINCREIGECEKYEKYGTKSAYFGWQFSMSSGITVRVSFEKIKCFTSFGALEIITTDNAGPEQPKIAVKVSGGLVQAVYANAAVDVEVYDLDVSDFPDEQDWAEHDEAAEQIEKIERDPAFHCAW